MLEKLRFAIDDLIRKLRYYKTINHIKDGAVVLDFGCGPNFYFLKMIENKIKFGYGFDKKEQAGFESEKFKIVYQNFDIDPILPLENNSIDQVVMLAVLEHVEKPIDVLKELYRVLKPGGEILLTTPTPFSKPILETIAFHIPLMGEDAAEIADHKHYFSKKELLELMPEIGFKNTFHKYFELGCNHFVKATK